MSFSADIPSDESNDTSNLSYKASPTSSPIAAQIYGEAADRFPVTSHTMNRSPHMSPQTLSGRSVSSRMAPPTSLARSGFRASPTQSITSIGSSRSYRITTETGGNREMTEDEVNALVTSALRRARNATTPSKISSPEKLGIMPIASFASQRSSSVASSPVKSPEPTHVIRSRSDSVVVTTTTIDSPTNSGSVSSQEKLGMIPNSSFISQFSSSLASPVKTPKPSQTLPESPEAIAGPEKLGMMPISSFTMQGIQSSHSESWSVPEQPLSRSPTQELDDILEDNLDRGPSSSFDHSVTTNDVRSQTSHLASPRVIYEVVVEETTSDICRAENGADSNLVTISPVKLADLILNNDISNESPETSPPISNAASSVYTEETVSDHVSRIGSEVILDDVATEDDAESEYTEETVSEEMEESSNYSEETLDDEEDVEQGMEVELIEADTFDPDAEIRFRALTGSPPSTPIASCSNTPVGSASNTSVGFFPDTPTETFSDTLS